MLEEKLLENAKSDIYPFHMPGHKRRLSADDACQIDITEIEGFDNLHHSQGILKEAQEKAAKGTKIILPFAIITMILSLANLGILAVQILGLF